MSKFKRHRLFQLAFVFSLAVTSLAQNDQATMHHEDPSWPALTDSMKKMHAAMSLAKSSGDNDLDFATLMLPHHQAAIDMAKAELLNGKDPQMRRLAQEIIADQQSEIELMQLWLKQHHPTQQQ